MSEIKKGRFAKLFQLIANHVPMGILDELHLRKRHPITVPDTFTNIAIVAGLAYPKCEDCKYMAKNDETWKDLQPTIDPNDCLIQNADVDVCPKRIWHKEWFGDLSDEKRFMVSWLYALEMGG